MSDGERLQACLRAGGVAVFASDTVYGLGCDPENGRAVARLYELKRRPLGKPSAVMFFSLDAALAELPDLGERTREALARLLPGGVTLLLPNPAGRYPLACGEAGAPLGVRVPDLPALASVRGAILQSSANFAGGPDARRLEDVPREIREQADLVLDGGELPGTPSTVLDMRRFELDGSWQVIRRGAVSATNLMRALKGHYHFHAASYEEVVAEIPGYDELQRRVAEASGRGARRILELGTGTGATAQLLLARHPEASLLGIDESPEMLGAARRRLPAERVELYQGRLQEGLPAGPFDLVVSALCLHHLDATEKATLFARIAQVLAAGGRVVIGDLVVPRAPAARRTPTTPGFDRPSSVAEQLEWLAVAGLEPELVWEQDDLAVFAGTAPAAGIVV